MGIIGTGATAIQAIPGLGAMSKELYVFQRTPSSIDVATTGPPIPTGRRLQPGWQAKRRARALVEPQLTDEQKAKLATMSREEKIHRQENANIDHMMRIHQRIEEIVKDKATAESLKPWYMFMCKRPCFHDEYLPTFNRPNVHLIDTKGKGITEITEKGPVFEGKQYELDVLIYATGFEVQKTGIYNQIKGQLGLDLNDKYSEGIRTLVGIHSQGFPNLFIMGGYQASFQFNLTDMLQTQGDHIGAASIMHVVMAISRWMLPQRPRSGGCRKLSSTVARPPVIMIALRVTITSRVSRIAGRTVTTMAASVSTLRTCVRCGRRWKSTSSSRRSKQCVQDEVIF